MPEWSATTQDKLRTRVFGMLTEAGYRADARTRRLQPVQVSPEVVRYLKESDRDHALRCMEMTR